MENNLIKYESNLGNFKSNIDISFSASNIIAITGLSGSGKSTIAKVICGLLKPVNGYIKINNKILYCSKNKINIQVISTSEIKISVLIDKKNTKKALMALHKEFQLDNKK